MPYLSQLLDSRVTDSADHDVGILKDVLIKPKVGQYVPLKFLAIERGKPKHLIYIPYDVVENFSREEVSLKVLFRKIRKRPSISTNFIGLRQSVMDQQIVDMSGARVVRVNDLRIGNFAGKMSVLGIDVSTKGLLRRLGLAWLDFFALLKVNLIDWRHAHTVHRALKIDTVAQRLNRLHPADLANIIEDLNIKHGSKLVKALDAKAAAKALEEVEPNLQKLLVKYLGPKQASDILAQMSIEEIVDLMRMLPASEAKQYLEKLRNDKKKSVQKLLIYPDDTAGGLMTLDFMAVRPELTAHEVIEEIRKTSSTMSSLLYVYVTDENGHFRGVVSVRWLMLAKPDKKMSELAKALPQGSSLHVNQKINEIMNIMTKYDLFTAVVLDTHHKLVGVVAIDDIMRHLVPNA
ncbi:MAG: CBS domain-containing protein [Candidatus Gracilibacteria bacterium]